MNKRTVRRLSIFFLLFTALLINNASADFLHIYMTDAEGSYTPKTFFEWDETPWLYLHLPGSGLNYTSAFWEDPYSNTYLTDDFGFAQEYWFSLDNWSDVRELGQWEINAWYLYAGGGSGEGRANFTVPEPMTLTLFVMGGGAILAGRFIRREGKNG